MKIAYVTIQFPVPSEAFAAVEMRALRRQGAELSVLSYRSPPANAREMLQDRGLADMPVDHGSLRGTLLGLSLVFLRPANTAYLLALICRHCWHRPAQLLKALLLVPRSLVLFERVKQLRPDVVHLYWGHYPSLLGLLIRRRLPETLVSQFLGAYDLEEAFALSGLLTRRADYLVTLSRANVAPIVALGADPDDVRISYHGVDIPDPLPRPRKTRGLMVIAERLVPQKCTEDAIRVFAEVRRDMPEARLLVLGDGPAAPRLHQFTHDLGLDQSVTFAGHVAHSEVLDRLAEAEVALTMSQSPSERLPNVMKEAMLRRCLCLSSRTAGIEELIDDGETGLIVDLGDVESAARRLLAVLRDSSTLARICATAQARIAADFNVDRLMGERLQQWSALRETRRAGARD
jgi:glycosyltransferase involved in cell wall biosynthesis